MVRLPRRFQLGAHLTKGLGAGANPEIGREGLLALGPEMIVEVVPGSGPAAVPEATVLEEWAAFATLPAVASDRVSVLAGDAYVRPGPRIVELVEAMASTLHPESRARGSG